MKGKLIAIEGIDGSGKETQTKLLYKYIKNYITNNVRCVSFPDYSSPSSEVIKMYLNGDLGNNPLDINAYAASSFFAVDRFVSYVRDWKDDYDKGSLILANRYTSSNASFQMAKIPRDQWDNYLKWIYDYEYNKLGIPRPNEIIYLNIPVKISQELIDKRYLGNGSKKDLHESNVKFLNLCEKASKYVAEKDGWTVVDCLNKGELKSIEQIGVDVISKLDFDKL